MQNTAAFPNKTSNAIQAPPKTYRKTHFQLLTGTHGELQAQSHSTFFSIPANLIVVPSKPGLDFPKIPNKNWSSIRYALFEKAGEGLKEEVRRKGEKIREEGILITRPYGVSLANHFVTYLAHCAMLTTGDQKHNEDVVYYTFGKLGEKANELGIESMAIPFEPPKHRESLLGEKIRQATTGIKWSLDRHPYHSLKHVFIYTHSLPPRFEGMTQNYMERGLGAANLR